MAGIGRTRSLWGLTALGLAWLALRPDSRLERALETLLAPTRALAELGAPLAALSGRSAHASEGESARRALLDAAAADHLREELARLAEPRSPELLDGRELVAAEVLGRAAGDRDSVLVRVGGKALGLERGTPAVHGEALVGRVERVDDWDAGLLRVKLVSARDLFVGALAESSGARLAVGGLALGAAPGPLRLAVHAPSGPLRDGELVRADELHPERDPLALLARGYELGRAAHDRDGRVSLVPPLDLDAGLYQLVLLAAPGARGGGRELPPNPLGEARWRRARVLVAGDARAAGGRAGIVLAAGAASGVEPGAALTAGGRLVGRVAFARRWSAHAALLGDAGLELALLASAAGGAPDGGAAPSGGTGSALVIGRAVSRGPAELPDGRSGVLFAWEAGPARAPAILGGTSREVRVFTSAGAAGVPPGLALGPALMLGEIEPGIAGLLVLDGAGADGGAWNGAEVWVRCAGGPEGSGGRAR